MSISHNFDFSGTDKPEFFPEDYCSVLCQNNGSKWEKVTPQSKYPVGFTFF